MPGSVPRPLAIPLVAPITIVLAALATVAALAGLLSSGGDGPSTVTTWRGHDVVLSGEGIYRDNSRFAAAGARGTDLVTLLIGLPVLLGGALLHRRGALSGSLLYLGGLTWLLYVYGSLALGAVAYNALFLVYVALFALSLWTLVATLTAHANAVTVTSRMPRRGPGVFLVVSGIITSAIWLLDPVAGLVTGDPPEALGLSLTLFTHALDMAIIAPAVVLAGLLVLRGHPKGVVVAVPLLILEALLAPMIAAQTWFQLDAGVELAPAEWIGPVGGFVLLASIAIVFLVRLFRAIAPQPTPPNRPR